MAKSSTKIIQSRDNPEPVEIIARAILDMDAAMKRIEKSPLKRSAIVTLIAYESKLPRRDIELVLNNLENLADTWIKKPAVELEREA